VFPNLLVIGIFFSTGKIPPWLRKTSGCGGFPLGSVSSTSCSGECNGDFSLMDGKKITVNTTNHNMLTESGTNKQPTYA